MEISKDLANSIVKEMKNIINKDLNFINNEGIIIASTDEKRVGTYHEGAIHSINEDKIVVIDWENQYLGSNKGINIPIKFLDKIIGVIGISGDREEVEKYGIIIKKMSEILIKESYLLRKREEEEEYEKYLVEKMIFEDKKSSTLGRVIIIKIFSELEREEKRKIFLKIKEEVKNNKGLLMYKHDKVVIIFFEKQRKEIEKLLLKIISKFPKIKLNIGIGNNENLKESYDEALIALKWCEKINDEKIFYDDMVLEFILNTVSDEIKEKYITKIFSNLKLSEIKEYGIIFECYEKHNGSLNKVSKELFIHANTLQYRLNKFKIKTGYDMRNIKDFAILKIAYSILKI